MKEEKRKQVQIPEELLEGISDLFLKYGLRSTSMDDICSHLKISKKTLYNFFENKDHLVEQVMMHRRSHFRLESMKEQIKPFTAVEVLLYTSVKVCAMLESKIPSNSFDMKKYHPAIYEKIIQYDDNRMKMILSAIMEKGFQEGSFRKDIDLEVQVYLLTRQIGYLGDPETLVRLSYPVDRIVTTVIENYIRSISTEKGLKELEEKRKNLDDMRRMVYEKSSQRFRL